MHPGFWTILGTTRAEAEGLLRELGLRALTLTSQADPLGEWGSSLSVRVRVLRLQPQPGAELLRRTAARSHRYCMTGRRRLGAL